MSNPKITVVTPTVREKGLALVEKALRGQTFRDFEWIIIAPHKVGVKINNSMRKHNLYRVCGYLDNSLSAPKKILMNEPEKNEGDIWSLNKAYNKAIGFASGELIISWQDWTFTKSETLENFWQHFKDDPKAIVSAVGNKYESDSWDVMTWKDPRERDDLGSYYECNFPDIEGNLAAIPKEALYRVGGFSNSMDKLFGMDFYNVIHRLAKTGEYKFYLDQSIKSYSLEHGRLHGKKWDEMNWLKDGKYNEFAREQPIKLDCL